ncbi:MAG: tRNA (guanine(37)-N1)-methyltransferase Trm5b [Methanomassiliicoccales archaeon PtaU1.Bin124]|nr:MAG: tRNA (guanine(37)-N1)-methyltransferase Trm5b [Methanomassiliicoccales archaeon PtaU1.Bin124]
MRSLCIRVRKSEGESTRKKLLDAGVLDVGLKVGRNEDSVLLPVTSVPEGMDLLACEEDFEERRLGETDYKKKVQLPDELRELLPTSFDIIGDIGIIRLPDELVPYRNEVGRALKEVFPRLRTVALDAGVKGEYRVRDLEVIAGDPELETVHLEYGLRLYIDPSKAYFNPRLANERKRVASLVQPGEFVVDMFAGVGPFALMIAKYSQAQAVAAIDINHDAVELMRRNIATNHITNVHPIEGDSRQAVFDLPCSDRLVMNLPHTAREFFADALTRLNFNGTMHLYHICERDEIGQVIDGLITEALGMGVVVKVESLLELKTYSPTASVYAIDLRLVAWA